MAEQIRHYIAHYGTADLLAQFVMVLDIETSIYCSNHGSMKRAKATAELADTIAKAKDAYMVRMQGA